MDTNFWKERLHRIKLQPKATKARFLVALKAKYKLEDIHFAATYLDPNHYKAFCDSPDGGKEFVFRSESYLIRLVRALGISLHDDVGYVNEIVEGLFFWKLECLNMSNFILFI